VIHQRLRDEAGLQASVASVRRYVRAHFGGQARRARPQVWRPPTAPGEEAQVDYGFPGTWFDPRAGCRRRVWAFSMVLRYSRHLFVRPVISMDQRAWVDSHHAAQGRLKSRPTHTKLTRIP
jgi:transposase